jgi:uncharacterized protein (DUF924 family)
MTNKETPASIVAFWFDETVKPLWYNSTPEFDQQMRDRFMSLYNNAAEGKLSEWESSAVGALALVIILDQFPLNMFRGEKTSFATEAMSREVAQRAMDKRLDEPLTDEQKMFMFLPFMHSESLKDQDHSISLFRNAGLDDKLQYAEHHRNIVKRFGRFPHRNEILQRKSTTEEINWLASDDGFKG